MFAVHGFLLDQNALSYIQVHDSKEILDLFNELNPETLVIYLPASRRIHRVIRSNVVTICVTEFRKRSILKKKPDFVSECIKSIIVPKNGGLK
jgi:hypothetical protein